MTRFFDKFEILFTYYLIMSKIIVQWSNFVDSLGSFKSIASCWHKAGFDKLISILDLIFPILERKMNVVTHFINHILRGCWLANDFNFLSWEEVDCISYWFDLSPIALILAFGMIANQSFQYFVCSKIFDLFFDLFG